jgi:hypothetical protein
MANSDLLKVWWLLGRPVKPGDDSVGKELARPEG